MLRNRSMELMRGFLCLLCGQKFADAQVALNKIVTNADEMDDNLFLP